MVDLAKSSYPVSERRTCWILSLNTATYRYRLVPWESDNESRQVIDKEVQLLGLAEDHRFG